MCDNSESLDDKRFFEVSLSLSPGGREVSTGIVVSEDEIDEYGEPPEEKVTDAVWRLIADCIGVSEISKEKADHLGYY
jgi:hypothetical protein